MFVEAGKFYQTRGGANVGPLVVFDDGTDGVDTDILGRTARFHADGAGSFDKHGRYLTGGVNCPMDLIAEVGPNGLTTPICEVPEGASALTVGVTTDAGLLLAEVAVAGETVTIGKAWIEPGAGGSIPVETGHLSTLGMLRNGAWRTFASLIEGKALEEARS